MKENIDEKKTNEEQILNDELLAKVAGGETDDDWTFNGSYVCPLCGKNHRFKFTTTHILHGFHFVVADEGDHCAKIDYLRDVRSINFETKTGILELVANGNKWISAVFFIV